jgi:hypothetical protein
MSKPADLPLSLTQELVLIGDELARHLGRPVSRAQYQLVARLHGPLDLEALGLALNTVVARHDALRASFHERRGYSPEDRRRHLLCWARIGLFVPGFFVQRIQSAGDVTLDERRAEGGDEAIWKAVEEECQLPLRHDAGVTVRATVIRGTWNALSLSLSHLTVDGWSLNVLVRELDFYYRAIRAGQPTSLPSPGLQWPAFAREQRRRLATGSLRTAETYWGRLWSDLQLDGMAAQRIPFAIDGVPHHGQAHADVTRLGLTDAESAGVRRLLKHLRITPYVFFRTVLTIVWSATTDTPETTLWANFANRQARGSDDMIGWCSNTHVVPITVLASASFAEMCLVVARTVGEARQHESLPLPAVWRLLGRNPYTSARRVNCDTWPAKATEDDMAIEALDAPTGLPRIDLDFRIENNRGQFGFLGLFNGDRYTRAGVAGMLAQWRDLSMAVAADPDRLVRTYFASREFRAA